MGQGCECRDASLLSYRENGKQKQVYARKRSQMKGTGERYNRNGSYSQSINAPFEVLLLRYLSPPKRTGANLLACLGAMRTQHTSMLQS